MTGTLVHLCTQPEWEAALQAGEYRAPSLAQVGFIHLSRPDQILQVANRFYRGMADALLLWIDPEKLQAEVRWEQADGEVFPHLYGPLNLEAVAGVSAFPPEADGSFQHLPAKPEN